ncbi:hypothetical protein GCM10027613_41910 [Microlunatus endophyticus]
MKSSQITRRGFLYSSAMVAGAAALAACSSGGGNTTNPGNNASSGASAGASNAKGSALKPLPKPAKFQQAPNIDSSLPSVEQRLPDNPYVIPHNWVKPGKYGGRLNMNTVSTQGLRRPTPTGSSTTATAGSAGSTTARRSVPAWSRPGSPTTTHRSGR